jgi:5-methylcytosine-specific restriction protein B
MNLAHVERYFADVLSGMESEERCLPNLEEEGDLWRVPVGGESTIPVPKNLMVIGTVNVDETTYMFSPKVLDRANTFEFRVQTSDLDVEHKKPIRCEPGDVELVAGFLTLAGDDNWQLEHPATGQEAFVRLLQTVHALLSVEGFEFGHRVFYEAVRFAAMHEAAGNADVMHSLDLQVLQKILPRLHGSRRRLESTLCALAVFCRDLSYNPEVGLKDSPARFDSPVGSESPQRLPRSYDKLARMIGLLRTNQFVSFTE